MHGCVIVGKINSRRGREGEEGRNSERRERERERERLRPQHSKIMITIFKQSILTTKITIYIIMIHYSSFGTS